MFVKLASKFKGKIKAQYTISRFGLWSILLLAASLMSNTVFAQEQEKVSINPNLHKKGIMPKHIRDMEAEKSHKYSKSPEAGGAIDVGTRIFNEMESSSSNESYDPNYLTTKEERRARWRKFFHPSDYTPSSQWDKRKREKQDSKNVINWKGNLQPRAKPDHEVYTLWEGDQAPKMAPDHEKYALWEGNLPRKRKPNHEQYSSYHGQIPMKRKALRTKLPGYQRHVKTKRHYDRDTEKGLWYD